MWVRAAVGSWLCAVVATFGLRLRDLLEPALVLPSSSSSSYSYSHPSSSLPRIDSHANSTATPRARKKRWRRNAPSGDSPYANSTATPRRRRGKAGKLLRLLPPWQQSLLRPLKTTMAAEPMKDEELFFDVRLVGENDGNDSDYDILRKAIAFPSWLTHREDEGLGDFQVFNTTLERGEEEEVIEGDALSEFPAVTEIIHENEADAIAVIGEISEEVVDHNIADEKVENASPEAENSSIEEETRAPSHVEEGGNDKEVADSGEDKRDDEEVVDNREDDGEMTDVADAAASDDGDDSIHLSLPRAEDDITSEGDALSEEGANSDGVRGAPSEDDIHEAQSLSMKDKGDMLKELGSGKGSINEVASGEGDVASSDGEDAVVLTASQENSPSEGDVAINNAPIVGDKAHELVIRTENAYTDTSEEDVAEAASLLATGKEEVPKEVGIELENDDARATIDDVKATPVNEDNIIASVSKEDSLEGTTVSENAAPHEERVDQSGSAGDAGHALPDEMLVGTRVPAKDEDDVKETIVVKGPTLVHEEFHEASAASMVPPQDDINKAPTLSITGEYDVPQEHDNGVGRTLGATSADEDNFVSSVSKDNSVEGASVSKDEAKKIGETSASEVANGAFSAAKQGGKESISAVNGHATTPPFMDKLGDIATFITFVVNLLFVVYSVAVHAFLSSFHERSFRDGRHWRPILSRITFALTIWGLRWVALGCCAILEAGGGPGNEPSTSPTIPLPSAVEIVFAATSIIASFALLLETRRTEVDGPSPPSVNMKGKVVFITGANTGIGLETARQLYDQGATVFLGCRSWMRALQAMQDIDPFINASMDVNEDGDLIDIVESPRLRFVPLDLTSNASVHEAAKKFLEMNLPLHVLILNAGVMRKEREETADGLEVTMAANHLGHFLLTDLLLSKLRETALEEQHPSRVLTVSSSLYRTATRYVNGKLEPGIDLHDLQCKHRKYALFEQYAQSKLANVMFALELGRRERERQEPAALKGQPSKSPTFEREPAMHESQSSASLALPRNGSSKQLHPKLTPTTPEESDHDETGLGFDDMKPFPSQASGERKIKKKIRPKLSPASSSSSFDEKEEGNDDKKKTKKKLRRSLTPSDELYDDEIGLGFHDIVPSPSSTSGDRRKKKKICPRLTPTKLNPGTPEESDDGQDGLGFDGISPSPTEASSSVKKKKKVCPMPSPASDSNEHEEKKEDDDDDVRGSKKEMRRRLASILLPEVDGEEDDDDTGFGFADVASTTPDPPAGEDAREDNDQGGRMRHKPISETASEYDAGYEAFCLVLSFCLHPGLVRTDVVRDMPWYLYYPNKIFSFFLAVLQKCPRAGASCSVYCAVTNPMDMADRKDECYFVNSEVRSPEMLALDRDEARRLWELSSELVSIALGGEKH